eukprot:12153167-Prorocentrum_lima.AAC.1
MPYVLDRRFPSKSAMDLAVFAELEVSDTRQQCPLVSQSWETQRTLARCWRTVKFQHFLAYAQLKSRTGY